MTTELFNVGRKKNKNVSKKQTNNVNVDKNIEQKNV
jgi:hypothetical protein